MRKFRTSDPLGRIRLDANAPSPRQDLLECADPPPAFGAALREGPLQGSAQTPPTRFPQGPGRFFSAAPLLPIPPSPLLSATYHVQEHDGSVPASNWSGTNLADTKRGSRKGKVPRKGKQTEITTRQGQDIDQRSHSSTETRQAYTRSPGATARQASVPSLISCSPRHLGVLLLIWRDHPSL